MTEQLLGFKNQTESNTAYLQRRRMYRVNFIKSKITPYTLDKLNQTKKVQTPASAVYGRSIVRDHSFWNKYLAYGN